MAYICDLAKELNKKEGIVINMLKKRGYLKENGTPRKATINSGLMREDGFIYKKGFDLFFQELGHKKTINKVKHKQTKEHNSEKSCIVHAKKEAQVFESQGAKSKKYFFDKYSKLEKEDLEEKLELAKTAYEAIIQDGTHDFNTDYKLHELDNEIKVIKELLNTVNDDTNNFALN